MNDRAPAWILVESLSSHTFDSSNSTTSPPTPLSVVAIGNTQKRFLPLGKLLSRSTAAATLTAVAHAVRSNESVVEDVGPSTVHAHPLVLDDPLTSSSTTLGLHVFVSRRGEPPPPRSVAGAWRINLKTMTALGNLEWAAMAGIPLDEWGTERALAAMFGQMSTHQQEIEVITAFLAGKPGTEFQTSWTVHRGPQPDLFSQFSLRIFALEQQGGPPIRIARGISHAGLGITKDAGHPNFSGELDRRLLEATTDHGEYRALIAPRSLRLIKWIGPPVPHISWRHGLSEPPPGLHPDDVQAARLLVDRLAHGHAEGVFRYRSIDGSWIHARTRLSLVHLADTATAVLARMYPF